VLPSSCSIGALCSLGPGVEAEVAGAGAGAAAAEEGAVAVEAAMADSVSPFKKGSAITKGAENICSGVNPAMLALQSRFDAGRVRMNSSV
jgi:hypothetical protein